MKYNTKQWNRWYENKFAKQYLHINGILLVNLDDFVK